MSEKPSDGGPAYPESCNGQIIPSPRLRDWFAVQAPEATEEWITLQLSSDRNKNPHNDNYLPRLRSRLKVAIDWKWEYADAMLAERERKR